MAKIGEDKNIGKATRFPHNDATKGGAPKGKRISTVMKELLDLDVSEFSDKLKDMDTRTAIAVELVTIVFHTDSEVKEKMSAIKEILDRTEGKPNQKIEQTNTTIEPLNFNIINKSE